MAKGSFCRATLIERHDFTHDLALFRFRPERPLPFRPGQYATIAVEEGAALIQRAYSIVSAPHEPDLEFFVELVPEGELTPRLWALALDDVVLIREKIVGRFTQEPSETYARHLMLATVTGIAPFLSMARAQQHALDRGELATPARFAVLHGASYAHELGVYHDELVALARTAEWLTYVPTVSRPWEDPDWQGETGRVEDLVRKYADALGFDATNAAAYACGHPQMIENAKGILARARFGKGQVKEEKYFVP
jgi:ferredoxin/flavodoxin---NADP+ reductase